MTTEEKPFDKDRVKVIYQDGRVTGGPTTMTDVDTLKPCPFCGTVLPMLYRGDDLYYEHPHKEDCLLGGALYPVAPEFKALWNPRPSEDAPSSRCDELERLAGAMATAIYRNSEEGCEMGRALDAAMEYTDYQQRKGE